MLEIEASGDADYGVVTRRGPDQGAAVLRPVCGVTINGPRS